VNRKEERHCQNGGERQTRRFELSRLFHGFTPALANGPPRSRIAGMLAGAAQSHLETGTESGRELGSGARRGHGRRDPLRFRVDLFQSPRPIGAACAKCVEPARMPVGEEHDLVLAVRSKFPFGKP
jgi:hypothetical protein